MCFVCGCKHLFHYGYDKFGTKRSKGEIDYISDGELLKRLLHGGQDDSSDRAFEYNLSRKRFKDRFGAAVANDESFRNDTWEWTRKTTRNGQQEEVMCNPEDVIRTQACNHDAHTVCSSCRIPFCNVCRRLTCENQPIPKALTNDNFVGYMMRYLVEHKVTWLEKTIASPVFTGLICYYIEGAMEDRKHLMDEAQPQRAYGVRGSVFSFLLPMDQIQRDIQATLVQGDLSQWPMAPDQVAQVIRVRFMSGPKEILNKFRELKVRAKVVKEVALAYIANHCKDMVDRPGLLKIHGQFLFLPRRCGSLLSPEVSQNLPGVE